MAPLTLQEYRPGLWVEVNTGQKHLTWRGIIESVDETKEEHGQVFVKWVGECKGHVWLTRMPDNLFTWMGGSHQVHIEAIHNMSDNLFHVARRENLPIGKMPLKQDAGFFCLSYECNGRCTNSVAPNKYVVYVKPPPKGKEVKSKSTGKRKIEETKPKSRCTRKTSSCWTPRFTETRRGCLTTVANPTSRPWEYTTSGKKNDETIHNVCNDKTDGKLSNLPRVPRFGLFTMRDVSVGEMLVIEYSAGRSKDQLQKVTPCLCGIKKCKKWLFKGGSARVS